MWVPAPAPYQRIGIFGTSTSMVRFVFQPGFFTYFAFNAIAIPPLAGIGRQNINLTVSQDVFITLYMVPRSLFNTARRRAGVLTWQPIDTGFFFYCLFFFFFL